LIVLIVPLVALLAAGIWVVPRLRHAHWLPETPAVDWQERTSRQVRLLAEALHFYAPHAWQGALSDQQIADICYLAWPEHLHAMIGTDPLKRGRVCDPWGTPIRADLAIDRATVRSAGADEIWQSPDDIVLVYTWRVE
jgi:hypothetical protein